MQNKVNLLPFVIIFFALAFLSQRSFFINYDADFVVYKGLYDNVSYQEFSILSEPSFFGLLKVFNYFGFEFSAVIFILSSFTLIAKIFYLSRFLEINNFCLVVGYCSGVFLLHEAIQIRIAMAILFFSVGVYYLYSEKLSIFNAIFFLVLSLTFHISVAGLLILLFFYAAAWRFPLFTAVAAASAILFLFNVFVDRDALESAIFGVEFLPDKILAYLVSLLSESDGGVRLLNSLSVFVSILSLCCLWFYRNLDFSRDQFWAGFAALSGVTGVSCFVVFSSVDVVAYRLLELFLVPPLFFCILALSRMAYLSCGLSKSIISLFVVPMFGLVQFYIFSRGLFLHNVILIDF